MDTTVVSHDVTARKDLARDARAHYYSKDEALERHFGVRDDETPRTTEDALERIKEGKFQLRSKEDRGFFDSWEDSIRWRHPDTKKDTEGYRAASEKLKKHFARVQQDVSCDSLEKAKAAVRAFEDLGHATFH